MAIYRFVQGIDYGPRQGTLGLEFHMAEGGDGTLSYLRQHPGETRAQWAERVRGVSCNALLLQTGEVVKMVDWGHASGNANPNDRADEYGYYGHHNLLEVLESHWPDPNTWSISMEICGWRGGGAPVPAGETPGPNDAQVKAAIEWGLDMRRLFPSLQGAWGHHDQSPKACPGVTPNMKAIFEGVGGHGLWTPQEVGVKTTITVLPFGGTYVIPANAAVTGYAVKPDGTIDTSSSKHWAPRVTPSSAAYDATMVTDATTGNPFLRCTNGFFAGYYVSAGQVVETPNPAPPAPPADCTAEVAAAKAAVKKQAAAMVRSDSETTALKIEGL